MKSLETRVLGRAAARAALTVFFAIHGANGQILYETGFEPSEGFQGGQTLSGQGGWFATRDGGNGVTEEPLFADSGVQAFVGFSPFLEVSEENYDLFVFRPLDLSPNPSGGEVLRFAVELMIANSTNDRWDCFRWTFFNTEEQRLFSIDFDNNALEVFYGLETGPFEATGFIFENEVIYSLEVDLDLNNGTWGAWLDGLALVTDVPITTTGVSTAISDASAVWVIADEDPNDGAINPGDNFMAFDNLRWSIVPKPLAPFRLKIESAGDEFIAITLEGEPNVNYTLQSSDDLSNWNDEVTSSAIDGNVEFVDRIPVGESRRVYRAVVLP